MSTHKVLTSHDFLYLRDFFYDIIFDSQQWVYCFLGLCIIVSMSQHRSYIIWWFNLDNNEKRKKVLSLLLVVCIFMMLYDLCLYQMDSISTHTHRFTLMPRCFLEILFFLSRVELIYIEINAVAFFFFSIIACADGEK